MIFTASSLLKPKAVRLLFVLLSGVCQHTQAQSLLPLHYVCQQADGSIHIDGLANEPGWQQASWTSFFVDIEGNKKPEPYLDTRVKMLWDSTYFYFYAEMEEPHLWARLKQRDTVIFYDNDFEIFIDPDGDTHNYYELEINALNTVWDLLLTRPYRDGGHAIDHWDIHRLKTAVNLNGTLNDPSDEDIGWSVEIAVPWDVLNEATRMKAPPGHGDLWRVNFSRVQWDTEVESGTYRKKTDPKTGKSLPEHNWVWSPMRAIAMHEPEFWGTVQFSAHPEDFDFTDEQAFEYLAKDMLYSIHRRQIEARRKSSYKGNLQALSLAPYTFKGKALEVKIWVHAGAYLARASHTAVQKSWLIDQSGRTWSITNDE